MTLRSIRDINEPDYDGILTPWLAVTDIQRSTDWYQQIVGFREVFRDDSIGWCELATAVNDVFLGLYRSPEPAGPGGATLTFGVIDLDAERARLEQRGVTFEGETTEIPGLIKMATFHDPDGNRLMFCQVLHSPRT